MPKSLVLRKGRISIPGQTYAITKCCQSRFRLIIQNPYRPEDNQNTAPIIVDSLRWMHRRGRAICHGYVIMPDHIHVMLQLGDDASLPDTMRTFASFTARKINEQRGWSGTFWQEGYYDHAIRNDVSYDNHLNYYAQNPVCEGYVDCAGDWPYTGIHPDW